MTRWREELAVVPRAGLVACAITAAVLAVPWLLFAGRGFPIVPRVLLGGVLAMAIFAYGFGVSYIYGDARRRGMRHVMWAVVAAVVPNALGFVAYFLLREPILQRCPACGASVKRGFAFCPQCGAQASLACPDCRRPLDPAWGHCAHCGRKVTAA
jgi:hypothetical protein